jgi:DNA-binding response OmpR family regulator
MFDDRRLLVVDDEETICQSCRRIFSPAGFRVETSSDARRGLSLAVEEDYTAILLDIRMPQMDGMEFLEALRKKKPDVPVIIVTGYPSIPNAASAMRLGAADYVTKPFTPEQITQAVHKLLRPHDTVGAEEHAPAARSVQPWVPVSREFRYWDEAWFQPVKGGAVRVGAILPRSQGGTVEAVWPPRVGWFVYQGLPMAGATITGRLHLTVPAPISGVVVARNELLLDHPSALWDAPCEDGWIAYIRPACFEEEAGKCKLRHVLLANADEASAREQCAQLESIGCCVRIAAGLGEVGPALREEPDCHVLMMDAASLGDHGPELAGRITAAAPSTRIVVIASPDSKSEPAYREQGIFYYAVEPFADNEIVDIVDAAFRAQAPLTPQPKPRKTPSEPVSRICITNHDGEKTGLVAEGGVLQRDGGLGRQLARNLAGRGHSIETTLGSTFISSAMRQAASVCDRVLVLLVRDTGRLPGSLVREELVPQPESNAREVITLIVQPASSSGGPLEFDARTTAALAGHIAHEMTL